MTISKEDSRKNKENSRIFTKTEKTIILTEKDLENPKILEKLNSRLVEKTLKNYKKRKEKHFFLIVYYNPLKIKTLELQESNGVQTYLSYTIKDKNTFKAWYKKSHEKIISIQYNEKLEKKYPKKSEETIKKFLQKQKEFKIYYDALIDYLNTIPTKIKKITEEVKTIKKFGNFLQFNKKERYFYLEEKNTEKNNEKERIYVPQEIIDLIDFFTQDNNKNIILQNPEDYLAAFKLSYGSIFQNEKDPINHPFLKHSRTWKNENITFHDLIKINQKEKEFINHLTPEQFKKIKEHSEKIDDFTEYFESQK